MISALEIFRMLKHNENYLNEGLPLEITENYGSHNFQLMKKNIMMFPKFRFLFIVRAIKIGDRELYSKCMKLETNFHKCVGEIINHDNLNCVDVSFVLDNTKFYLPFTAKSILRNEEKIIYWEVFRRGGNLLKSVVETKHNDIKALCDFDSKCRLHKLMVEFRMLHLILIRRNVSPEIIEIIGMFF